MPTTREIFMKCFRMHFEIEESIELIKQRLCRRPKFNVDAAFSFLDSEKRNFITLEALRKTFADNKLYPGEDDLVRLLYRFDKTKNGRVTYHEFVEELAPKNTITL
jgi:Ca2+-binding EF-hand superfamily protein